VVDRLPDAAFDHDSRPTSAFVYKNDAGVAQRGVYRCARPIANWVAALEPHDGMKGDLSRPAEIALRDLEPFPGK
jgi:hypothetical protein